MVPTSSTSKHDPPLDDVGDEAHRESRVAIRICQHSIFICRISVSLNTTVDHDFLVSSFQERRSRSLFVDEE